MRALFVSVAWAALFGITFTAHAQEQPAGAPVPSPVEVEVETPAEPEEQESPESEASSAEVRGDIVRPDEPPSVERDESEAPAEPEEPLPRSEEETSFEPNPPSDLDSSGVEPGPAAPLDGQLASEGDPPKDDPPFDAPANEQGLANEPSSGETEEASEGDTAPGAEASESASSQAPDAPASGAPSQPTESAPDGMSSLIDGFTNALRELTQAPPRAPEPVPSIERGPEVEPTASGNQAINDLLREWLGIEPPPSLGLLLLLLFTLVLHWIVERARRPLPERGLFPRALGALRFVLRFAIVLIALMLISRLLPTWLHPALLLVLAAFAVALGFGAVWVLLPDLIGGMVLLTEGGLKRGQWVSGEGFAGAVEQVGARVTLLRAADGSLLSVPNRRVVRSPVRANERAWHEVDVELRAPAGIAAARLREAIREAVISSPYVPPDPGLVMVRDPRDPERWRLTVRLVHVRFSGAFEGQLLERVEEALEGGR